MNKILLQNLIMSNTLLEVCTAYPCPMGYPQPGLRGRCRSKSEGKSRVLFNIRKMFKKQALERSEQNFVTKLNHAPHLAWGLFYMSIPNGLPQAQSQRAL